jgi:haloacetate dehalogenase
MTTHGWFDGFTVQEFAVNGTRIHARVGGRPDAPPLLLLHGFPQSHVMWHRVARQLATDYRLVLPDLRGYGRSAKPAGEADHSNYSKRTMARDLAVLMRELGHTQWFVAGHDRGGRVAHRMALDAPDAVRKLCVIDIVPTLDMYEATDMRFASAYYHWFFLIQPAPHPERMIGADPMHYLHWKLGGWGVHGLGHCELHALAEYERCFAHADTIHAACEDYRAAAGIDLDHDRASREAGERVRCDMLALWGARGVIHALFDPLPLWRAQCAGEVSGLVLPAGHYIPEELPEETAGALHGFLSA